MYAGQDAHIHNYLDKMLSTDPSEVERETHRRGDALTAVLDECMSLEYLADSEKNDAYNVAAELIRVSIARSLGLAPEIHIQLIQ